MIFRQIIHDDLGCASYLIGDEKAGIAAVVDPRFDVDEYLDRARYMDVTITDIFETHNHADHVSGHGRLAAATGATIHVHRDATPAYEHEPFDDGDEFELGALRVRALHTPGHRPEHTAFALIDTNRGDEPWAVLTGDTLFVNDIARPDLAIEKSEGARGIFRSLQAKLLNLPDDVEIWPGHLGGSMCGGPGMDMKVASTIGFERDHNPALAIIDEDEFVEQALAKLGPQPPNYRAIVEINTGPLLTEGIELLALAPRQVERKRSEGALLVDVRTDQQFDEAHIPDAISNPMMRAGFGTKLAWLADSEQEVVLIGRDDEDGRRGGPPGPRRRHPHAGRLPPRRDDELVGGAPSGATYRASRARGPARCRRGGCRASDPRRPRAARMGRGPHPRIDLQALARHRRSAVAAGSSQAHRGHLRIGSARGHGRQSRPALRRPAGHPRGRRRRRRVGTARPSARARSRVRHGVTRFGFALDQRSCIGCHACTVACKQEHGVELGVFRTWVKYIEQGVFPDTRRYFSVLRCNHCDDAPCVEVCPVTALFRREDGIVDFDSERCIGCKACLNACPYDALYIDPKSETAAKCNFCAHRVDQGLKPSCEIVCPTQAIVSGDIDDPESEISRLIDTVPSRVRAPEQGTQPKVFYLGAHEASLDPLAAAPAKPQLNEFTVEHRARLAPLVDEARASVVADASHHPAPWGWRVSSYFLTKGVAAGAMMLAVLLLVVGAGGSALADIVPGIMRSGGDRADRGVPGQPTSSDPAASTFSSRARSGARGWRSARRSSMPRRSSRWPSPLPPSSALTPCAMPCGGSWSPPGWRWRATRRCCSTSARAGICGRARCCCRTLSSTPILAGAAALAIAAPFADAPAALDRTLGWSLALSAAASAAIIALDTFGKHPTRQAERAARNLWRDLYARRFWAGLALATGGLGRARDRVPGRRRDRPAGRRRRRRVDGSVAV